MNFLFPVVIIICFEPGTFVYVIFERFGPFPGDNSVDFALNNIIFMFSIPSNTEYENNSTESIEIMKQFKYEPFYQAVVYELL